MTPLRHAAGNQAGPTSPRTQCSRCRATRLRNRRPRWATRSAPRSTVDNALKMMMVKSANDMAVLLAEEASTARSKISPIRHDQDGSRPRHDAIGALVNPNGLPADGQIVSALAIWRSLARSLIHDFPEYNFYWHIPAIKSTAAASCATTTPCSAAMPALTA